MIFVAVARLGALEGTIIKHLNALLLNLRSPIVIATIPSSSYRADLSFCAPALP
jgi:hypothetical protein